MLNSDHNSLNSELQMKFDTYCKKCLRNAVRNINKKKRRIAENEVSSNLSNKFLFDKVFSECDRYFNDEHTFEICGVSVVAYGESIIKSLLSLHDSDRDIILMSYYLEMTDQYISGCIDVPLSTVNYRRNRALKNMKVLLEKAGYNDNE